MEKTNLGKKPSHASLVLRSIGDFHDYSTKKTRKCRLTGNVSKQIDISDVTSEWCDTHSFHEKICGISRVVKWCRRVRLATTSFFLNYNISCDWRVEFETAWVLSPTLVCHYPPAHCNVSLVRVLHCHQLRIIWNMLILRDEFSISDLKGLNIKNWSR